MSSKQTATTGAAASKKPDSKVASTAEVSKESAKVIQPEQKQQPASSALDSKVAQKRGSQQSIEAIKTPAHESSTQSKQNESQTAAAQKSVQQTSIQITHEIKEEKALRDNSPHDINDKQENGQTKDEEHIGIIEEPKKEEVKPTNILIESGLANAYDHFQKLLCKNGLPVCNIFEYAAQEILKFEKEFKKKKKIDGKQKSVNTSMIVKERREKAEKENEKRSKSPPNILVSSIDKKSPKAIKKSTKEEDPKKDKPSIKEESEERKKPKQQQQQKQVPEQPSKNKPEEQQPSKAKAKENNGKQESQPAGKSQQKKK